MPNSPISHDQHARRQKDSIRATICCLFVCLFVLIGAISSLVHSSLYYASWLETTATVVDFEIVYDDGEDQGPQTPYKYSEIDLKYCPKIQFFTLDHSRNITAVLKTSCDKDFEDLPAVGDSVDIQYDPSDLSDVVDADIPSNIGIAMVATIVISTLCSCGYVMFGIMLYKAEKARNNTNSMQNNHSVPYDNNHTGPSSIPMSNIGGDSNQYAESSAYDHHNNTSNGPVETTASAVPIAQHEVQAQGSAPMVSIFPDGTITTIASEETAPPMVGAILISSTAERNSQTYVSPASLPTIPQSTYVSPSEVNQARATANGPL